MKNRIAKPGDIIEIVNTHLNDAGEISVGDVVKVADGHHVNPENGHITIIGRNGRWYLYPYQWRFTRKRKLTTPS